MLLKSGNSDETCLFVSCVQQNMRFLFKNGPKGKIDRKKYFLLGDDLKTCVGYAITPKLVEKTCSNLTSLFSSKGWINYHFVLSW